jgi:hypothetical protein
MAVKPFDVIVLLQQLGPPPFFPLHMLGQEREDRLVPDPDIARLENPVVLIGEVQELRLLTAQ